MTTPVPPGGEARLAAVAAWDPPLVRGAVATLRAVAGRFVSWRRRVDALALSFESAECWSGPAARSAAAALLDVSSVAAAVDAALAESLLAYERLAIEADAAQELATEALALAADLPAGLEGERQTYEAELDLTRGMPGFRPEPGAVLAVAEEAFAHAAAAAAAASAAEEPLVALGVLGAWTTPGFADLLAWTASIAPVAVPGPPARGAPEAVAGWWAALPLGAQLTAVRTTPQVIGSLDGVPAWARDRANRLLLHRALADPGASPSEALTAQAVAGRIAAEEAAGVPVQLHLFDLAGERVALALGDLDTADAVAVLVPGVANTPGDDIDGLTANARRVVGAVRTAEPGLAVAAMVWLGYRTPQAIPEMLSRSSARRGGATLDVALDGLDAARGAGGARPARTTVLAHSYGTVVVDEAADRPGALAADAVVLLGSPGMEATAASLEVPEVYDAGAVGDPISWSGHFGITPWSEPYGSTGLPVEPFMGHSDYYDRDRPTLAALGEVVVGDRVPD